MSLGADYLADYAYEIHSSQKESVCGRCRWNRYVGKGFCCGNARSENYTDYTAYSDSCDEWQEK